MRSAISRRVFPLLVGALFAIAAGTLYRLFSWKGRPDR